MTHEDPVPTTDEAHAALDSVGRMEEAGRQRGAYPPVFCVALGVWSGLFAFLIGVESPLWMPLFVAGLAGFYVWRQRQGAWILEVATTRQFSGLILPAGLGLGVVFILGNVGRQDFDLVWAPYLSALTVGGALFLATWAHRATPAGEEDSA